MVAEGRFSGAERGGWREPAAGSRIPLAVALAATFLVYAPTLGYEFVSDDRYQIVGNPHLQSWHFLGRYFTGHVWSHVELSIPVNHYRPVFLLWLRFNYLLFGLRPWGWHLTTVGVHLVVTLLVYLLARRILREAWSAGFAALVFGLHPIHLESVAWVSGVTDPLSAMFLVGSFLAYQNEQARLKPRRPKLQASWALYFMALLSKETAVVLPFIILTYECVLSLEAEDGSRWDLCRKRMRAALSCASPYLALAGTYLVARAVVLKGLVHPEAALPFSTQVLTLPSVLWFYIKHMLWPVGLNAMYDLPYVTRPDFYHFVVPLLGAAGTILGLMVISLRSSRIAFAAVWLMFPLLPVLVVSFQPKDNLVHDRFLYMPCLGLALMAGIVWSGLEVGHSKVLRRAPIWFASGALVAGLLATGTLLQSGPWSNDLLYAEHNLSGLSPSLVPAAKDNLGIALADRGRLGEAMRLWQEMLAVDPASFASLYNLGYYSYRNGRFKEAEQYLLRALKTKPSSSTTFLCLGLTRFKMGRLDEAEADIHNAIALRPEGYGSHFALGFVLKTKGDRAAALREFKVELRNNPGNLAARNQIREIEMNVPPSPSPARSRQPSGSPGLEP